MAVSEDTLDEVKQGREAKRILDSPVFQRAIEMTEDQIIQEWRDAETVEERERYHALQEAPSIVKRQLRVLAGRAEWHEE